MRTRMIQQLSQNDNWIVLLMTNHCRIIIVSCSQKVLQVQQDEIHVNMYHNKYALAGQNSLLAPLFKILDLKMRHRHIYAQALIETQHTSIVSLATGISVHHLSMLIFTDLYILTSNLICITYLLFLCTILNDVYYQAILY